MAATSQKALVLASVLATVHGPAMGLPTSQPLSSWRAYGCSDTASPIFPYKHRPHWPKFYVYRASNHTIAFVFALFTAALAADGPRARVTSIPAILCPRSRNLTLPCARALMRCMSSSVGLA
ncbi:hypothetical protein E2P81_ATG05411 [Venturia nashicola]|nr:hypothetical protein E2P81_ATG05411 [Venturia nashicola]